MEPLFLAMLLCAATPSAVPRYGVFEHTIDWDSASIKNPWEDVQLSVALTSPKGAKIEVGGFYHGPNTWKFRFCPSETGKWQWTAKIADKARSQTFEGSFDVVESKNPGLVRQSPHNKFRWVFDNGAPYYPLGIGDCVTAAHGANTPFEKMGIDGGFRAQGGEGNNVSFDDYLSAYSAAGLNIFRWSVDNCAFGLYDTIEPEGNVYKAQEGIWGDQLAEMLRRHGFRICMAFFGFKPPYPNDSKDPAKMAAVKRYVQYVVNRYGAYVDFWELMNEYPNRPDTIDDDWIKQVASYLKSIDPYHHMVSTSWARPDIEEIDICSPHWYERENEFDSDLTTTEHFQNWKSSGKPVVVGEQGNRQANWDMRAGLRIRIRTWATFFNEGSLIFWNTSFAKDYRSPSAANVYLGPEERGYLKALQDFTAGFDPKAQMVEVEATPKAIVRAHALAGPAAYAVYMTNYVDHTNPTSGAAVTIEPTFAGTATWLDPSTGNVLASTKVPAGKQTMEVPKFVTDVALKIVP